MSTPSSRYLLRYRPFSSSSLLSLSSSLKKSPSPSNIIHRSLSSSSLLSPITTTTTSRRIRILNPQTPTHQVPRRTNSAAHFSHHSQPKKNSGTITAAAGPERTTTLKAGSKSDGEGDGGGERRAVPFDPGLVRRMTPTMRRFTLGGKVAFVTG